MERRYLGVDSDGLASSARAAEDRTRWKGMVLRSSMVHYVHYDANDITKYANLTL